MRERLFAHIQRCLKPGGMLLLQGYTPKQLEYRTGGPPLVSHLYTEALLREAFAAMDIVTLREYEADVAEGSGHLRPVGADRTGGAPALSRRQMMREKRSRSLSFCR